MTIAIAQMTVQAGAPALNTEAMLGFIEQARRSSAEVLVFPELAVSGLLVGDLLENTAFLRECEESGLRIAQAAPELEIIFGNLACDENGLHNCIFRAKGGRLRRLDVPLGAGFIRGAYRAFAHSTAPCVIDLTFDGKNYRAGLLLGDWQGRELPYAPGTVDLILDVTNKPLRPDDPIQPQLREGCAYLSVNSFGLQNSGKAVYLFGGGSEYFAGDGGLLARAADLTCGLYVWSSGGGQVQTRPQADELLGQALVSGVREFMASIRSNKAVIGISGGIDSALAACIYRQALGPENVCLISMPSRFNSQQTKSLAAGMAEGLGVSFATMPIQQGVDDLLHSFEVNTVCNPQGAEFNLRFSDSAKENVQARERGRILASAAAAFGGVFTCNGNKAELSVGYATFYGDLAGAFAAQGDLWKYQVYRASSWFQRQYPAAPLDAIAAIRPSAELSEKQDVTKGLGDPLIYRYHDYLLRHWVEGGADLSDTLNAYRQGQLEAVLGCEPGLAAELFADSASFIRDSEYWWRMYRGTAIAKRIQSPPLLALSARPFGEEHPQSQGAVYYSAAYLKLKEELLANS